MIRNADREIVADLYLSRSGLEFVEELVERFGSRFGGTPQEQGAARFIKERFVAAGADEVHLEPFECLGWTRRETSLVAGEREIPCIALPYCPPGEVEGPLVYLGDGDPQVYADQREQLKGAIVMVSTAYPKFFHRGMHRGEKLGRALEAGAIGFIWMRGEPGGLPETGSARFGKACEVPCVSVSYESGHEMLRMARGGGLRVRITSANEIHPVTSYNVLAEFRGQKRPEEILIAGAHYDGHDISQSAMDDGAGIAVVLEAARALGRHKHLLDRTVRLVGFAQEEMGLLGSEHHAALHGREAIRFMLNLDGAGRGNTPIFELQGRPEATAFFRGLFAEMHESEVVVGDRIGMYSDMYPFAARGFAAGQLWTQDPSSQAASRGWGHTPWDSLDKVKAKPIEIDAARVARLLLRLATMESLPFSRKSSAEFGAKLKALGFDEVLRYEVRLVPGEE